jgi:hypothetical protein
MEPEEGRRKCDTVTCVRSSCADRRAARTEFRSQIRLVSSVDPLTVHRGSSSRAYPVIVPLMQLKQDLTFEIQDERTAGFGPL